MKEIQRFVFVATFLTLIVHQQTVTEASEKKRLDLAFLINRNKTGHYGVKLVLNKENSMLPKPLDISVRNKMVIKNGVRSLLLRLILSEPSKNQHPLPVGYDMFANMGYYKFYPNGASSFSEAKTICERDNAHLAIVNSIEEAEVFKLMYARNPRAKNYAWMGFHDLNYEGRFVTIFGTPIEKTGYVKWHYNQPDKGGVENCGAIDRQGYFHDLRCKPRSPWPFFCEYGPQVTFS